MTHYEQKVREALSALASNRRARQLLEDASLSLSNDTLCKCMREGVPVEECVARMLKGV